MNTVINALPRKRRPIFGVLSIAFPLAGIPISYLIGMAVAIPDSSGEPDVWGAFAVFMMSAFFVIISGFVSAIVAFCRAERPMILPFLGLVANCAPIAWYYFRFRRI
jgi:hypothetical protein